MQRLQQAPSPTTGEEAAPMPSGPALEPMPVRERLELLRLPSVEAREVDAFLAGLQVPYLPGESPRERADLMLELLGEERLCELTGSTGQRVGVAALETLLRLGYPYAYEVTPEMLARARGGEPLGLSSRSLVGLGYTALNILQTVLLVSEEFASYLDPILHEEGATIDPDAVFLEPVSYLPLFVLALLVPPVLSALFEWRGSRIARRVLTGVQAMVGLMLLIISCTWVYGSERFSLMLAGVLAWVIAACLHPREEPPEP